MGSPALPACTHGLGYLVRSWSQKRSLAPQREAGHWPPYTFMGSMPTSGGSPCAGICSEAAGDGSSVPSGPTSVPATQIPCPHVGPPAKHRRKRSWGADECGEPSHLNRPGTPPARRVGTGCPTPADTWASRGLSVFMSVWLVRRPVYSHPRQHGTLIVYLKLVE